MPDFAVSITESSTDTLTNKTIELEDNTVALRQYTTQVFITGGIYYAKKADGTVLSSGSVFETVFQAALDNLGTVFLCNNSLSGGLVSYTCSGSFAGFNVPNLTTIIGDYGTIIYIPNGYNGNVFLLSSQHREGTHIKGLTILEAGTPSRLWTGIKVQADAAGTNDMQYCIFRDISMYDPGVGIELEVQNSNFINSNIFENILIFDPIIGVLFDKQSGDIRYNSFKDVNIQGYSGTTHGFKDVDSEGNTFLHCSVWDIDSTDTSCNILDGATDTTIIGGKMTGFTFTDRGRRTNVIDGNLTSVIAGLDSNRQRPFLWTDCLDDINSSVAPWFLAGINSGTASSVAGDGNHIGIVRFTSSTSTNSGNRLSILVDELLLNGGEVFEAIMQFKTFTNTTVRIGLHDSTSSSDAVDGVYFEVPASSSVSGKTANNSTRSTTGTSFTASIDTWYRLRIIVTSSSRVDFFIFNDSGVQQWTDNLTANIPTARNVGLQIVATNSGTSETDLVDVDYIAFAPAQFGSKMTR